MIDPLNDPPDDGLSVRRGVTGAPIVNPATRAPARSAPDVTALFAGIRAGDRVALGQGVTLVESGLDADRERALDLLDRCQPFTGQSMRVGISGPPGVGKSTLIDAIGIHLEDSGLRVAVLAVDPSSERSGGSILGDKTRMGRLAARPQAFIRPSPSGGVPGGVGRATRAAIAVVEASGFDAVVVETVGTGQSETAVRHMVDTLVLLNPYGAGDELQGIKRGIAEAADIVAVTKADGDNRNAALAARDVLREALGLLPADETGWRATVLAVSARDGDSVAALWNAVDRHREHLSSTGALAERRRTQGVRWLHEELTGRILAAFRGDASHAEALAGAERDVASGERHPYRAAEDMLRRLLGT